MNKQLGHFLSLIIIFVWLSGWLGACDRTKSESTNLTQDPFIQVYFNHNQSQTSQYTDPYRQINRFGDNLEALVIKEINSAQNSIDIAVQELRLPNIAQALAKKYRQGVKIRVIIDNNYSRSLDELDSSTINKLSEQKRLRYQELFTLVDANKNGSLSATEINKKDALRILHNTGIPVIDDTADGSKGSGLMHHKLIIIDQKKVITGSANFTLSGMHGDFSNLETRGNVNHLLLISNQELANIFTEEFNLMWGDGLDGNQDSKFGLDKPVRSPQLIAFGDNLVTVQFSPTSSTQNWQNTTNGLIGKTLQNAHSSIDLALFVFSEQKLADILQNTQQKNVKIRGLFDAGFAFRYYSEALDLLGVSRSYRCKYEEGNNPWQTPLQTVGIPSLPRGDKLHHKFAIVDDNTVITGSQNWSTTANHNNDETVLIIQNPLVAAHFQQEFDRLYAKANLGLPQNLSAKLKSEQTKCQ
ncbi:MAG: phospholipase D-like domain-containing protein [Xenococcaceae cyanobacterium MO_188.B29]|nr:phospholipase D-like domain-containing protein [Xenococcaceae cyanobacterium MO_188.B29]